MSPVVKFVLLAALVVGLVIVCAKPLGGYIADIMEGRSNWASRLGARLERWLYRMNGVKPSE
ncbi:MAG TPA: potassium-transporting ATPase subunit KdpA, partial [Steroidobacteraceae bacterium]